MQTAVILFICFIVHSIFLVSVFDIYFQSPIIDGILPLDNELNAAAKRLVLFIADGVRTDSFFEIKNDGSTAAPFLRHIIKNRGCWGISNTRVPTESRPGHVAIIAGFYEDPSAIFKGWKDNPIEFDTVFNRSKMTFGWGSPDILLMFSKGAAKERVIMETYSSKKEVFFSSSIGQSLWSFEKFKETMDRGKLNGLLRDRLMQDKIIFFLHLLGPDTSGHSDKPGSGEYFENIKITDQIAENVQQLLNDFYGDDDTAYIYTSDHGMTDWGSHGDGSAHETETPFVAWGAGVSGPQLQITSNVVQQLWKLDGLKRNNINQVDIPALISILLGTSIPVHSMGILPMDILNTSAVDKSRALFLNARQLYARYIRKRQMVEENTLSWLYIPFNKFSLSQEIEKIQLTQSHFMDLEYEQQIRKSKNFISVSLAGLAYYENYYQHLLLSFSASSYIGWICWLILNIVPNGHLVPNLKSIKRTRTAKIILDLSMILVICLTIILLKVQKLPYQYYFYCCLPLVIWWDVLRRFIHWWSVLDYRIEFRKIILHVFIYTAAVEFLVLVFFERYVLGILTILFVAYQARIKLKETPIPMIHVFWLASCFIQCSFPFLPIIGTKPNNVFLVLVAVTWTVFYVITYYYFKRSSQNKRILIFLLISFSLTQLTVFNVYLVTSNYQNKEGLSLYNQVLSWSIFLLTPVIPIFTGTTKIIPRLLFIFGSLGNMCLLFSVSHETMFFPLFSFHLMIWFLKEYRCLHKTTDLMVWQTKFRSDHIRNKCYKERDINLNDFRIAFLFYFYAVYSFFATGNIASVNSFDPSSVRSFLAVFSPFTMMILMLIKIIIPFIAVSCVFRAINIIYKAPAWKMFLIVLIFCSLMGLNFSFAVKNVGSWLDIGSSVSRYVIAQTTTLFLVLIYYVSHVLTDLTVPRTWKKNIQRKRKNSISLDKDNLPYNYKTRV